MKNSFTLKWRPFVLSLFTIILAGLPEAKAEDPVFNERGNQPELYNDNANYVYRVSCRYSFNGASWYDDNNGGSVVEFTDDKLYISNLCGGGTIVGDIIPGENRAAFQNKQEVDDASFFTAYYDNGSGQVEPEEFYFDFTEDHNTITLSDINGSTVIIGTKYASGYWNVQWKEVTLTLYPKIVPTPPEDCNMFSMSMAYIDNYYDECTQMLDIYQKDDNYWFKDMVYKGAYMQGERLSNGDIRFSVPQFQGVVSNYLSHTFAKKNGTPVETFDIILQENGSYLLEENVEIWKGELDAEYMYLKEAVFNPVSTYDGAPLPPTDVEWDGLSEHFVNFKLPLTGENGEELNREWTYWQVLIDGEPYQFTYDVYKDFTIMMLGDPYYIDVNQVFYHMDPTTWEMDEWGDMGDGNFKVYLPEFTSADNISIRCGYQRSGQEMKWSEAVAAGEGEIVIVPLPEEGLYSSTVRIDTPDGSWLEEGIAMYARFTDEGAQLSGFFGHDQWIEGEFVDEKHQNVNIASPQLIGMNGDKEVKLYAATLGQGSTSSNMQFIQQTNFDMIVSTGGEVITMADPSVYLLEVTDGEITNVWYGDIRMTLVHDEVPEIPTDAVRRDYYMTYRNRLEETETAPVQIYQKDNDIWIDGLVRSDNETAIVKGNMGGENIVIDFPQFVGVLRGLVSYGSSDPWSFYSGSVTLENTGEGGYTSDGEIWIGLGTGWPIWRAATDMVLRPNSGNPDVVIEDVNLEVVTATTASFTVNYTLENVPEDAKGYLYITNSCGGEQVVTLGSDEAFSCSVVEIMTDLLPATQVNYEIYACIVKDDGSVVIESERTTGTLQTVSNASSANEGEGNMKYQFDYNFGWDSPILRDFSTQKVYGRYENGVLEISNMPWGYLPISFIIDPITGAATAANQLAVVDNEGYWGDTYYFDVDNKTPVVNGYIENVKGKNGTWSVLTIDPWGEAQENNGYVSFQTAFYNNTIVFDFMIPGLGEEGNTNGLNSVVMDSDTRYFTIQGIEVKNPEKGHIYIKVENHKTSKVIM